MPYDVTITKRETGESRSYTHPSEWTDNYIWCEGNYACDCNRAQFFAECVGEDDPNILCSDNLYTVSIAVDGKVVYEDDTQTAESPAAA
ncbi:hypothetical protein [Methylobacterium sp. E-045]|uniref:hypothetical protein n=1 Tax=Methylobacterium sp. E-045 TaxID=2836575 RepID=UPI001FB8C608|nr:hypothetical protein [Methylobacterium sp. E-045]MCJ2131390.1 hypothetical protein [Methylobacterium sp. E-045]